MSKTTLPLTAKNLLPEGGSLKFIVLAAVLCLMSAVATNAQTMKTFGIGPGTSFSTANYRAFFTPGGANVDFLIIMDDNPGQEVPLVVEIFRPGVNSIGSGLPHGPLTDTFSVTSKTQTVGGDSTAYTSDFGCPSSWRIRVRTANNQPSPVRVTGRIFFSAHSPETEELDMQGGTETLEPGETATRTLKIRHGDGVTIDRMGRFRIKAKWHTDAFQGGFEFFRLRVRLLRPDGSVAASEFGFSQHAPNDGRHSPKIDFTYNMTPEDANQSGDWEVQIVNDSGVRLIDFDIDSILDPAFLNNSFRSRFQASSCN